MRKTQQVSTAKEGGTSTMNRRPGGKSATRRAKHQTVRTQVDVGSRLPQVSREFVIQARQGSEVLFELRSRDPRDLLQVIWSRVKGIKEIVLTVEESRNGRQTTRDTLQLRRTRHLYDDLLAVSGKWLRGDFGAVGEPRRK